jgi:uncharacterized protein (TIGR02217 family)
MAVSQGTQWENRLTGDSIYNGSGFDSAFGGVDYSQQDSPQASYTDLVAGYAPAPTEAPVAAPIVGGSGTIPAGTYYVVYTLAMNDLRNGTKNGETPISTVETAVTLSGTGSIRVTPPTNPGGVNAFRVYISTVSGSGYKLQRRIAFETTYLTFDQTHDLELYDSGGAVPPAGSGTLVNRLSSVARPFVNNDRGNILCTSANVSGWQGQGTRYQIQGIASGGVAIVDGTVGAAAITGGTMRLGGGSSTNSFITAMRGGNTAWIKTQTPGGSVSWTISNSDEYTTPWRLVGYNSFRGDNQRAVITLTGSQEYGITGSGNAHVMNLDLVGGGTVLRVLTFSAAYSVLENCIVRNGAGGIQTIGASNFIRSCYVHTCKDNGLYHEGGKLAVQFTRFTDPAPGGLGYGIRDRDGDLSLENCIIDGFTVGFERSGARFMSQIKQCVFDNNSIAAILFGRTVNNESPNVGLMQVRQNIFTRNGTAIRNETTLIPYTNAPFAGYTCNAFWDNTLEYYRFPSGADDTLLSADPFTNADAGNYSLNNEPGGGQTLKNSSCVTMADGLNGVTGGIGFGGISSVSGAIDTPIADFEEVRFPENISKGAVGGPMFKTQIVITGSASEQRIAIWNDPLWQWDVSRGLMTGEDHAAMVDFFVARMGRATAFRFKDWSNYLIELEEADQIDPENWQIVQRFTSGTVTKVRKIKKPVEGTVQVFDADDNEVLTGWEVDTTTGVITFDVAPVYTPKITCEFDIPVRFDTDQMDATHDDVDVFKWEGVKLVEVRF